MWVIEGGSPDLRQLLSAWAYGHKKLDEEFDETMVCKNKIVGLSESDP